MKTLSQIKLELMAESHPKFAIINGEQIELDQDQQEKAINNKAEMIMDQLKIAATQAAEADATATQKAALLARLGITADEAKLLIG